MKRNKFLEWLGYKYILNTNTGEIHKVSSLTKRCKIDLLKNGKYISAKRVNKLYLSGAANGCRYCYKDIDTDN